VLTEDATPTLKISNVGAIVVTCARANAGKSTIVKRKKSQTVHGPGAQETIDSDLLVGKINEVQKATSLIGAQTS
jgi:hypothetical protein